MIFPSCIACTTPRGGSTRRCDLMAAIGVVATVIPGLRKLSDATGDDWVARYRTGHGR